jgi:hypothetical protein
VTFPFGRAWNCAASARRSAVRVVLAVYTGDGDEARSYRDHVQLGNETPRVTENVTTDAPDVAVD